MLSAVVDATPLEGLKAAAEPAARARMASTNFG